MATTLTFALDTQSTRFQIEPVVFVIEFPCSECQNFLKLFVTYLDLCLVEQVFEALRYKLKGRRFGSRWCH
jgi:hypothetical protein